LDLKNRGLLRAIYSRANGEARAAFDVIALGEDRDVARHDQPNQWPVITPPRDRTMLPLDDCLYPAVRFEDIDDVPEALPRFRGRSRCCAPFAIQK
jgi:hypothetical protein